MQISLVQPNFQQGPKEFNAYYLPYSVGVLWAYIQKFEDLKTFYSLNEIIWRRDRLADAVEKLKHDDIVAFSTYVWNKNYNYELARRLKEVNPKIITIFGGPEMPHTKKDVFQKLPFIDVIVRSEGELIFKDLLECIKNNQSFETVKGLTINQSGEKFETGDAERIQDLAELPSPYLTGVFDKIMAETKGVEWNVTIETNRGCPYACTFCDWGSLTYNKVKKFELERVFLELEWAGQHKCGFVTLCDANFGMFVERDNLIADKLLEVQEKYGSPTSYSMAWAKDQKEEVFNIVFKLIKSPKYNQGLTVSVQSMDLDVLENIKRKNLSQHKIDRIFAICEKNNVPVYTEVILGLPGETKETWKEGIFKIIRAGNHTGINFFHAQLLENAEMNLLQRKLHKITSVPVYDYMSGSYVADELPESVEVVTGTSSMPPDDMIDCMLFDWMIQTFHVNGLTTYVSRILEKQYNIDYSKFYEKLQAFLRLDPWFQKEELEVKRYYENWMSSGRINHYKYGNVEVHGWNLIHRTTLNIHNDKKYDYVFNLIEQFLQTLDIDQRMAQELVLFQKNYLVNYDRISEYPFRMKFNYDFIGYLQDDTDLLSSVSYLFEYTERTDITFESFLENIYFGRKRNFGKSQVIKLVEKKRDPVMDLLLLD